MEILTEIDKAYIAGFFDGEGCISISKYQGKNNRTPVYSLQVVIVQKGIDTLAALYNLTKIGTIHSRDKYHPDTYEWHIPRLDAVDFLTAILPYLRNKKMEAEVAIEYQEKQGRQHFTGLGYTVSPEHIAEKEMYYQKLHKLKGTSSIGRGRPVKSP